MVKPPVSVQIHLDKPTLMLLMALISLAGSFIVAILPYYFHGPQAVLQATTTFITGVVNIVVVWLNEESSTQTTSQ